MLMQIASKQAPDGFEDTGHKSGASCTAVGLVVQLMLAQLLTEVSAIAGQHKFEDVVSWLAMQTEVREFVSMGVLPQCSVTWWCNIESVGWLAGR